MSTTSTTATTTAGVSTGISQASHAYLKEICHWFFSNHSVQDRYFIEMCMKHIKPEDLAITRGHYTKEGRRLECGFTKWMRDMENRILLQNADGTPYFREFGKSSQNDVNLKEWQRYLDPKTQKELVTELHEKLRAKKAGEVLDLDWELEFYQDIMCYIHSNHEFNNWLLAELSLGESPYITEDYIYYL